MRNYIKCIKSIVFLVVCLCVCFMKNDRDVYGCVEDGVITTDIWATAYDENGHWQYCTLCGETKDKTEHVFTKEYWAAGYESCYKTNYCTRICECGYSYTYRKPHAEITVSPPWVGRYIHYSSCAECNGTFNSESCYNDKGRLSCLNPGVCSVCGANNTSNNHYIGGDGCCDYCKEKFVSISEIDLKYATDRSYVTAVFTLYPEKSSVTFSGWMNLWTSDSNFGTNNDVEWSYVKNSDGSCTYTGKFTFLPDAQRKCTVYLGYNTGIVYVNGKSNYLDYTIGNFEICQDNDIPELIRIDQVDQKISNDWATIKELSIYGRDKYSKLVTISIRDKETGEYAVKDAKAEVINGEFVYKCTPPLEGPVEGRTYVVEIVDQVDNKLEKDFIIYKTDSKAPRLASDNTYTKWSQTKIIKLELADYGAGSVQTSITDQDSYLDTSYENKKYYAEYVFAEENYGTSMYTMFMRDGLGNATKTSLTVGKIDNTKPTIIDAVASRVASGVSVAISANDFSKKLNAEGSGVSRYAITDSILVPTEDKWQTSNDIQITRAGTYYLWVKDVAGNVGDALRIKVDDNLDINIKDKYIYDKGKINKDKIDKGTKEQNDKKDIDDMEKNDVDKYDLDKYDDTPKTGDYTDVQIYGLYLTLSFVGMVILISCRKRIIKKE